MKPKYFAYNRKSTDTREKQMNSLESQKLEILRRFGDQFEIEFLDEKRSAFIPNNRPVFDDMLRRLEAGEAEGLIAWDPSRLSRNEVDAARITYMLRTKKLQNLQFCTYTFVNTPEGIMMLQIMLSQSQYESSKKGVDVLRDMLLKCEKGWFPNTAPNGYLNREVEGEKGGVIVVDELRFPLIRKAMELVLSQTHTAPAAHKILTKEWGYRTAKIGLKGGDELALSAWYSMLRNHFYCGVFTWRGKQYPGKHKAMVTFEEFERLQRILGHKSNPRPKSRDFAFRGPLQCASCGCAVTASAKHKFIKKSGSIASYTVYNCTHKCRTMTCPDRKYLGEEKLREQIGQKIHPLSIRPPFLKLALEVLEEMRAADRSPELVEDMLAKSLASTEEQLRNLVRMRAKDQVSEELYLEEKAALERTMLELQTKLIDAPTPDKSPWFEPSCDVFRFAYFASHKLCSGSLKEQRMVLRGFDRDPKLAFGILQAEPERWYLPIIDFNTVHKEEIERLEPKLVGSDKQKDAELEPLRLAWCSVVQEVRTIFDDPAMEIPDIPKFGES